MLKSRGQLCAIVSKKGTNGGKSDAVKHPEKIEALVVQNGNAYDEGLEEFWEPLNSSFSMTTDLTLRCIPNGKSTSESINHRHS